MRTIIYLLAFVTIIQCTRKSQDDISFQKMYFIDTVSTDNLKQIEIENLKNWKFGEYEISLRRHFYFKDLIGKFKIIKVTGDDYDVLRLLTFDNKGKLTDQYDIAGSNCSGPDCPVRRAIMISHDEFIIKEFQEFSSDSVEWKTDRIDSTEWKIKVNKEGKIISEK